MLTKWRAISLAVAGICFNQGAQAQGVFAGPWKVTQVQNAPWVNGKPDTMPRREPGLTNARIEFKADRVVAPKWMGCKKVKYEMMALEYGGLFEGGLHNPQKGMHDAAEAAARLGYKAQPVKSMLTSCSGVLFHLVDDSTAQFALDNMIYTMRRTAN